MAGRWGDGRASGRAPEDRPDSPPEHPPERRTGEASVMVAEWLGASLASCAVAGGWVWAWRAWGDRPIGIALMAVVTVLAVALLAAVSVKPRPGRGVLVMSAVLCLVLAALVAVVTFPREHRDACGRPRTAAATEVMVVWEGEELADFCDTLVAYDGSDVVVTSVGEDIGAALEDAFAAGRAPDLAIVPQPNLVRRYGTRGLLCEVPTEVAGLFPDDWSRLVSARVDSNTAPVVFGAFVKGAHKSLLWYDLTIAREGTAPERWSWDQMRAWLADNAERAPYHAPLAVPAESQWPLTDWFENELASRYPDLYASLASLGEEGEPERVDWRDPRVAQQLGTVLDAMADLWSIPGLFVDGPAEEDDLELGAVPPPALTTWEEAAGQVAERDVALAFGPSFMAGPIEDAGASHPQPMGFPGPDEVPARVAGVAPLVGDGRPILVGGDAAIIPELDADNPCPSDHPARNLLRWLTGDGMAPWAANDPGFLTPNERSPALVPGAEEDQAVRNYLTRSLRDAPEGLFFDLSDNQFALANDGDPRGTWEIFADFFAAVTGGRDRAAAVGCVVTRLEYEYRGAAWPTPCAAEP